MVILVVILLLVLIPAATWWFGLWNNFLTLINVLLAGLIASSYYETLGARLASDLRDYAKLADFLALWVLFVVSFIACRIITEFLSGYKMEFDMVTEMIGRSLLSIWIACVFVAFTLFSFHMAPLHPDAFQKDPEKATLGIGPDRMWLAFIQSRSRGALSTSRDENFLADQAAASTHPDDADLGDVRVFDPNAQFIDQWHRSREQTSRVKGFR